MDFTEAVPGDGTNPRVAWTLVTILWDCWPAARAPGGQDVWDTSRLLAEHSVLQECQHTQGWRAAERNREHGRWALR